MGGVKIMQNYKDQSNKVHFLDSAEFEHLLPSGCVPITDDEAEELSPKPAPVNPILTQIAAIEATITPRRLREAMLTETGKLWLEAADADIAALRAKL